MSTKRPKITKGYRLGSLTASADTGKRKNGYTIWLCECDCGGTIELDTRALQRGGVTDCGCRTKVNPGQKDLTGQRFGKLIALEPTADRANNGSTIWRCRCDCGVEALAVATQLTQGYKKSCGCLGHPALKDYVGQRFGKLTVTGYAGKDKGMHRWLCLCDCGQTTVAGQTLLQNGKKRSCGCLKAKQIVENMKYVDGTSVTILEKRILRLEKSNGSGHLGVYHNKKTGKWIAQIGFKKSNVYLGTFGDQDDAITARQSAEDRIYGEFLAEYYRNQETI